MKLKVHVVRSIDRIEEASLRSITISQVDSEVDDATESYLFDAIQRLERLCDSLLSCRIEIEGGSAIHGEFKPWRVKVLLCTGEHDIFVAGEDDCRSACTPRQAINNAMGEAQILLQRMKSAHQCAACSDRLSLAAPDAFAH